MTLSDLEWKLINNEMKGYILGLDRSPDADKKFVSHIYKGTFNEVEKPMCNKGWNRGRGSFSIWRNNLGLGVCRNCLKNTLKEINKLTPDQL